MRLYKLYLHINLFVFALIIVGANSFKIDMSSIFVLEKYSIINSIDMQWMNEFALMCLFGSKVSLMIAISILIILLLLIIILYHRYKNNKNNQQIDEYKNTLEQNQVEINSMYSFFTDIYIKTNNKGDIMYVSPSVLGITGYESSFYDQKHISELFACLEEWNDVLELLQKAETIENKSYSAKTKNGKAIICSVTINEIKNYK
ncbi:MAG: PAS domain-containing protein, partial [Bacteroidales bacterium]|nr:PAS domain-containing protein [Bacteroidales bacterium]